MWDADSVESTYITKTQPLFLNELLETYPKLHFLIIRYMNCISRVMNNEIDIF